MNTDSELNDRLAREADQFFTRGGAPLDIVQVLDRAGEIRRGRRMRATMLMAACVLAIAVPTGLVATRGHDRPITPAPPTTIDTAPLSLADLEHGPQPHDGYARAGQFHLGTATVDLSTGGRAVASVARVTGGVLVATRQESGDLSARFVDDQGAPGQQTWPMTGGFAVSADGNVAAFAQPDGTVIAVQDAASRYFELGRIPTGSGFDVIAVQGENCSGRSEEIGCKVFATTNGEEPQTFLLEPHQAVGVSLDSTLSRTVDVAADRYAAVASVTDTGSCSDVRDGKREILWSTCDHRFLSFSPDGAHVLASAAYGDGLGDTELAVLDSATGRAALGLRTADGAAITQMVWEDDSHVLANLYQDGRWAVVRIGLDGHREYAVAPVRGNDYDGSPFLLPSP
jgi:hypothetical protein